MAPPSSLDTAVLNTVSMSGAAAVPANTKSDRLKQRLNQLSVIASIICAIDCTVLPLLLLMVSVGSGGAAVVGDGCCAHEALHRISQQAALYFVLPLGGTAALSSFVQHRHKGILAGCLVGLGLIYAANMPAVLAGGAAWVLSIKTYVTTHHQVLSLLGCATLTVSQLIGQSLVRERTGCGCGCDLSGLMRLVRRCRERFSQKLIR